MARWMGILALEPVAGARLPRQMLTRAGAERLVPLLAAQLGRFLSVDHEYGLSWAAAAYDPAQLLRAGFPLHHELGELFHAGQRQGLSAGQTLTLAERDGAMPTALLVPELALGSGPLLAIPVVLSGSDAAITLARARLESELFEAGLADPAIALELTADFGVAFDHVRWLSLMDLIAMMATQLDNVGFGPVWQLIEEVLLGQPAQALDVQTALGQPLHLDGETVWSDFLSFSLYARLPEAASDAASRLRDYLSRLLELRQLQALLAAHAIAMRVRLPQTDTDHACSRNADDLLVEILKPGTPARVLIHEHPSLGVLAYSLADARGDLLEHRYPLSLAGSRRCAQQIQAAGWQIERPGQVLLDAQGLDLAGPQEPSALH